LGISWILAIYLFMMPTHLTDQLVTLESTLPALDRAYYRLALVVGKAGSGKTALLRELSTRTGHPLINVNLQISERLLDYTIAERPRLVPRFLGDIVHEASSRVVLLDNLELLFDATLSLNPLQMLQSLSRNTTLVAAWSGTCSNRVLTYAEVGHPEERHYELSAQDAVVVALGS
jgi:hypothetical protein